MDKKYFQAPSDAMGVKDSEHISAKNWTLQELERFICLVLEEPRVPSESKTITDIFIENKRIYLERIYVNIKETKNSFLESFNELNECIDDMTEEIIVRADTRRKELKQQLNQIKIDRSRKWDRQLFVCEGALQELNGFRSSHSFHDTLVLDQIFKSHVNTELELVDSGKLNLEAEDYPMILQIIENLGTIKSGSESGVPKLKCVVPKFTFGSAGGDYGQFCRPWGVCSDETGRILVCDRCNHRVQVFNESGQFLIQFGKAGSGPGEFNRPTGIAVDKKCRVIVADKDNHRIQVFTYSGHYLFSFGNQGTKPSEFMYPWDVAVNQNCQIAVSDSKNHRIQLFTEHGVLLNIFDAKKVGIWGSRTRLRFLDCPRGLAFTPDGSLLVTDFNNHRVLLINEQFSGAKIFGGEGHSPGQFFRPQGITCDKSGKFAVADCKNYRIQIFDNAGNLHQFFGSQGAAPGQFDCPQGICYHPNRNLVVVDFNNNRIQVF